MYIMLNNILCQRGVHEHLDLLIPSAPSCLSSTSTSDISNDFANVPRACPMNVRVFFLDP